MVLLSLALILSAGSALAGNEGARVVSLLQPIDTEVRAYLASPTESKAPEALDALANKLLARYDGNLEEVIDILWDGPALSEKTKAAFKHTVVREHVHKVWLEMTKPDDAAVIRELTPQSVVGQDGTLRYVLPESIRVNNYVQVAVDIFGGQGGDCAGYGYDVNGDNDLYHIIIYDVGGGREEYELWFYDEDQPTRPTTPCGIR